LNDLYAFLRHEPMRIGSYHDDRCPKRSSGEYDLLLDRTSVGVNHDTRLGMYDRNHSFP
jgi:hypothetical protein